MSHFLSYILLEILEAVDVMLLVLVLMLMLMLLLLQYACQRGCVHFLEAILLLNSWLNFSCDMSLLYVSYLCLFFWLLALMNLILVFLLNINNIVQKTLSRYMLLLVRIVTNSKLVVHLLILVDLFQDSLVLLHLCERSNILEILE